MNWRDGSAASPTLSPALAAYAWHHDEISGYPFVNVIGLMGVCRAAIESAPSTRPATGQGIEWTRLSGTAGTLTTWRSAAAGALGAQAAVAARQESSAAAPAASHAAARRPRSAAVPAVRAECRCRARATCRPPARQPSRQANVGLARRRCSQRRAVFKPLARPAVRAASRVAPTAATSAADIAAVKQVIEAARKGKEAEPTPPRNRISDPVARKLVEWVILRSDDTNPSFAPLRRLHRPPIRAGRTRRCSAAAPRTRCGTTSVDDATVRAFFATHKPLTAKGRFVLARALLAKGDRAGAAALVREAWRNDDCQRRSREQGARDVRRPAHARRPQGAHGAALLRRRHRRRHARGRAPRRQRAGDRAARAPR